MAPDATPAPESAPTNGAAAPAEAGPPPEIEALQSKHREVLLASGRLEQHNRALQQRLEELEGRSKSWEEIESKLKQDPMEALKHYGHTMQALTDRVIDSESNPETPEQARMRQLEQRIEQLNEQLTGTTQTLQSKEQQAARAERLAAVDAFVESQGEEMGALRALGATGAVLDQIMADAEQRGYEYTDDEVIETLRDREQKMRGTIAPQIKGLASLPWARELFAEALKQAEQSDPPASKDPPAVQTKPSRKTGKTSISNADATEVASTGEPHRATDSGERHSRAAARILRNRAARG